MLLNNHWVREETKKVIKRYIETNEINNTPYQYLKDVGKVVL